ncbi:MAG: histidine kinase [Erythrobacter sp.]|jgi:signal transduction histidine kinase|nr:histidine kinase [Erythrobacter sp.]
MIMAPTPEIRVSASFRNVLLSIIGLWTLYFVLISARGLMAGPEVQLEMLWRRCLVCAFAIVMTLVLWLILRLFEHRKRWVMFGVALVAAMPAALAIAQVNQILFEPLSEIRDQIYAEERGFTIRRDAAGNLLAEIPRPREWHQQRGEDYDPDQPDVITFTLKEASDRSEYWFGLIDAALSRYYILLIWVALYIAILAIAQTRLAERREQEFRSAAKAAELRSLRYQVNPHFLFNTLNSLSALVMTGKPQRAEAMIQSISRFYRHSLADDPTTDVRLEDEFELQREYLDIEAVRFPDRLRCVFDLPKDLADARIPGMILQPLVENSVKYAVSPVAREVTITLAAREEFDRLVVSVSDNGPGVPAGSSHGFGIGLANVRDRLEARFGPDIAFTSAPVPGGYRTEMRIPLTRKATRHGE